MSYWLSEEKEGIEYFDKHEMPWLFASIINTFKVGTTIMCSLFKQLILLTCLKAVLSSSQHIHSMIYKRFYSAMIHMPRIFLLMAYNLKPQCCLFILQLKTKRDISTLSPVPSWASWVVFLCSFIFQFIQQIIHKHFPDAVQCWALCGQISEGLSPVVK